MDPVTTASIQRLTRWYYPHLSILARFKLWQTISVWIIRHPDMASRTLFTANRSNIFRGTGFLTLQPVLLTDTMIGRTLKVHIFDCINL